MALVLDGDNGIIGVLATNTDGDVIFDTDTLFVDAVENKVGIGTTAPNSNLHIKSTTDVKLTLETDEDSDCWINLSGATSEASIGYEPATNSLRFANAADGVTSNVRMTIDASGNVGIGTDNPTQPLEIKFSDNTGGKNGLTLHNTSTSSSGAYSGLVMKAENATVTGDIFAVPSTGSVFNGGALLLRTQTNHPMVFQTNSSNRMTILADGNVGIGTTNPGQKLTIEGTADNTNSEVRITATGVASGYLGADSNGFNIGTDTAGLYFKTGVTGGQSVGATGSARMVINSSGNVGIGTVSPARQLSIVDDGTNGQAIMEVIDGTNDNLAGIFLGRADNTNIGGMRYFHSDNSLRFRSNDKDSLVIDNQNDLHVSDTTLGSQLYTQSNAGAGSGGTESNATTGWAVGYTGATIASVGTDDGVAPNTGSYQLKYTGTNNGSRVDYGFAVEAGKRYQVTLNSDWHQGSLYALVYVATSASGDNLGAAISPVEALNNTTYAETKLSFGATVTGTVYLSFRMASTSSPQNVTYVDNISIKEEGTKSIFAKDQYLAGDLYVNGQIKLANLASDPSAGTTGGMYFNTTSGAVKVYDGSSWDQIQALTPFSTINSRYQPHTQVNTQGAGASKITTYGATAWSEFNSSSSTQFGGHDGHDGSPADYPAYVAVYLGGRHAVNRLNIVVHGNSFGFFELQGSNNAGTGGSYSTGSWTSLPFVTSNNSSNNQNAGGQGSGLSEGTVLTFQYDNNIAYQSYRLWIKDNSIPSESVGTRYQGWATYYWELYRV